MKARLALTAIFIAYSVCFAEKPKTDANNTEMVKSPKEMVYERDSIKCYVDSISLLKFNTIAEATIKSQEFYSNSFEKIQSVFTMFLEIIGVFVAIIAIFAGGSFFKIKNDFEKYDTQLSDLKQALESQKKYLDSNKNVLFDEIGNMYFSLAIAYFKQEEWSLHFDTLSKCYEFLITYRIDIQEKELNNLIALHNYTKLYIDKIEIAIIDSIFQLHLRDCFGRLSQFKQYCEETNKQKHLEVVKRMYYSFEKFIDVINRRLAAKGAFI